MKATTPEIAGWSAVSDVIAAPWSAVGQISRSKNRWTLALMVTVCLALATFGSLEFMNHQIGPLREIMMDANRAASGGDRELEQSRAETLELVLANPGILLLAAVESTFVPMYSIVLFHLVTAALCGVLSKRWGESERYLSTGLSAAGILVIGVVATTLLRTAMGKFFTLVSGLYYLPWTGYSPGIVLIGRTDAFTLWYLVVVGMAVRTAFRQKWWESAAVVGGVWVTLVALGVITAIPFYLIP